MWLNFRSWLNRPVITDPVDAKNAVFMQILLFFVAIACPLNKIYVVVSNDGYDKMLALLIPSAPILAGIVDVGTSVLITICAWIGFYLMRQGRFRPAVGVFLGGVLGAGLIAYSAFGLWVIQGDFYPLLAVALGGLMLGRRALVTVMLFTLLQIFAGLASDGERHARASAHMNMSAVRGDLIELPSRFFNMFMLILIIDRSSVALRQSLRESNQQRHQLQRALEQQAQAQDQLVHARKMDAVGRLASGVAHDFNNVLGVILGFARERHRLDEPEAERSVDALALGGALRGVELAAQRGASVTRKLLSFSRQDVTLPERFDAGESLRELQPLLRQLMPASVVLVIESASVAMPLCFDRSQFELAWLNLVSNAVDAMPDRGGTITIAATRRGSGPVRITVHDDGEGMPEEIRQRIFEPFFTTKPSGRGTGLGLSVVYGMVERAGGSISVQSASGAGTTFILELPAVDVVESMAEEIPGIAATRVLLIDDDDDLRDLLARALQDGGCQVSTAANGAEAERHVRDAAQRPQVLVCDNRMPDTDASALLSTLRRHLPQVPVILISAGMERDGPGAASNTEFTERLPKPFAPELLLARVTSAAAKAAWRDQSPAYITTST